MARASALSVLLALSWLWVSPARTYTQEVRPVDTKAGTPKPPQPVIENLSSVSPQITQYTNELRKAEGLNEVVSKAELSATANYFARFMATEDKYEHTADGSTPGERAKKHGYQVCIVSENIAYQNPAAGTSAAQLGQAFFAGWKDSAEHRENILDPDVRETAVAVHYSQKSGKYYAVQLFGRSQADAIRFQVKNPTTKKMHYRIGKKEFFVDSRYTRTHELCRSLALEFLGPDPAAELKATVKPQNGDLFVIHEDRDRRFQMTRHSGAAAK